MGKGLVVILVLIALVCGFAWGAYVKRRERRLFRMKMAAADAATIKRTIRRTDFVGRPNQGSPIGCPVENCRIRKPHSHAGDLVRRLQGQ